MGKVGLTGSGPLVRGTLGTSHWSPIVPAEIIQATGERARTLSLDILPSGQDGVQRYKVSRSSSYVRQPIKRDTGIIKKSRCIAK